MFDFWVARDKCGYLYLYDSKPIRLACAFGGIGSMRLTDSISSRLNEITWDNSPVKVCLTIK